MEELKQKLAQVAERIIFEALQLILNFKMLSVVLSGLVLIRIFFEETYIYHLKEKPKVHTQK